MYSNRLRRQGFFRLLSTTVLTLILISILPAVDENCVCCHAVTNTDTPEPALFRAESRPKTVGVMDKGQVQINTGNFGNLADYLVWYTNSIHWPRNADDIRQYGFGLGLVVAVNDTNVIETISQHQSRIEDWQGVADGEGHLYSGEITAASDGTPFQATSDFRETWPEGYYDDTGSWISTDDRIWPGYFRVDVTHDDFPSTIVDVENEFTSDRDVFTIYNDDLNPQGAVGIEVHQSGYSYGRPYAEDIAFWEFQVFNKSGTDLHDIYIGFYAIFRPDYDFHDYLNFIDTDNDGQKDFVYVYDLDNQPSGTWSEHGDPLGMVGLKMYDTPHDLGVTDFHHFARGVKPTLDGEFWALMTSTPRSADTSYLSDPRYYFHGSDPRIDYTGTDSLSFYYPEWLDNESGVSSAGDAINYVISTGPFDMPADTMITVSLGLIMGDAGTVPFQPDTTDIMANLRVADDMHTLYFQGSGPPQPPIVTATAHDGSVNLYWTSEPSESSVDILTGIQDFEGYKIFRSMDQGESWGYPITDHQGETVGFVPLAVFDKIDGISGLDPGYPQTLGGDYGLQYFYSDSNLVNGLEYWYCVTAFDTGNQDPDELEMSYMYPIGSAPLEQHLVSVTPAVAASNLELGLLKPEGAPCSGTVQLEIVDDYLLTGHGYKLSFSDSIIVDISGSDTSYGLGFSLLDTTLSEWLIEDQLLDENGKALAVQDGFLLNIENSPGGIYEMGWTKVAGDTCTFDWRLDTKYPHLGDMVVSREVNTYDDWRITVDYETGSDVWWYDYFANTMQDDKQHVPLRFEIVTDEANPLDVTDEVWLCEFAIAAPWETYRKNYYSPLGWDLEPGGTGYLPGTPGWYEKHLDFFILQHIQLNPVTGDTIPNYMYLMTNNKPDTSILVIDPLTFQYETLIINAVPPADGDQFTIRTFKPFRSGVYYTFGTGPSPEITAEMGNTLAEIRVVPDPYIVTNTWETSEFGKKLMFNHLPDRCTIRIFTLVGEPVVTLEHNSATGSEFWDLRTRNDQYAAPGTYLYYAVTPDGHSAKGRFLIVR